LRPSCLLLFLISFLPIGAEGVFDQKRRKPPLRDIVVMVGNEDLARALTPVAGFDPNATSLDDVVHRISSDPANITIMRGGVAIDASSKLQPGDIIRFQCDTTVL